MKKNIRQLIKLKKRSSLLHEYCRAHHSLLSKTPLCQFRPSPTYFLWTRVRGRQFVESRLSQRTRRTVETNPIPRERQADSFVHATRKKYSITITITLAKKHSIRLLDYSRRKEVDRYLKKVISVTSPITS